MRKWTNSSAGSAPGYRPVLGDGHDHTLNAINCLAELYRYRGDLARSEALYKQALEAARGGLGDEHPRSLESMAGLARIYAAQGQTHRTYRPTLVLSDCFCAHAERPRIAP